MLGKLAHWNGHNMKFPYIKDKQKRKNFLVQEEKLNTLKSLKKNKYCKIQMWARHKLDTFQNQSINNRCIITLRGASTNGDFKLSRLEFRRWALSSNLPGVVKGSW